MATFSPIGYQFFDSNGTEPLSGGKVYTYAAGTTTAKATYTSAAGTASASNPIILNSAGRAIFFLGEGGYKFVIKDNADNTIDTIDNVNGTQALGSVDTISDLRALKSGQSESIFVAGRAASGDGGGGWFYWDETSSDTDDGALVVSPSSNPSTGRWVRIIDGNYNMRWFSSYDVAISLIGATECTLDIPDDITLTGNTTFAETTDLNPINFAKIITDGNDLDIGKCSNPPDWQWLDTSGGGTVSFVSGNVSGVPFVDPKWWGAVGDNSNDDTTAFQAALDTGLPVHVQYGIYKVSSLTITNNYQRMFGDLKVQASIRFTADGTEGLIVRAPDVTIENLYFKSSGSSEPSAIVSLNGYDGVSTYYACSRFVMKNCNIDGVDSARSTIGLQIKTYVGQTGTYNCHVYDTYIEKCATGVKIFTNGGDKDNWKTGTHTFDNVIVNTSVDAFDIDAAVHLIFKSVDVELNTGYGYRLAECNRITWYNCWTVSNTTHSMEIGANTSQLFYCGGTLEDAGNSLDGYIIRITSSEIALRYAADIEAIGLKASGGMKFHRYSSANPYAYIDINEDAGFIFRNSDGSASLFEIDKRSKFASATTANDTATALTTIALAEGESYTIKAFVVGATSNATNMTSFEVVAAARRSAGGSAVLVGQTITKISDSSFSIDCYLDANSNNIRLMVQGLASPNNTYFKANIVVTRQDTSA